MSVIAKISVREYERMIAAGVFEGRKSRRIELIWGELREMSPIGTDHAIMVDWLSEWSFENAPRDRVRVRVQNPVAFLPEDSEPQPDIVWAKRLSYRGHHPAANEILLLIEVADSSLETDRGEKAHLYAAAGVMDYWIVNLAGRTVEVRRDAKEGRYHDVQSFATGSFVQPLAVPDLRLSVDVLFASLV